MLMILILNLKSIMQISQQNTQPTSFDHLKIIDINDVINLQNGKTRSYFQTNRDGKS